MENYSPEQLLSDSTKKMLQRVFLESEDGRQALNFIMDYCMVFRSTYSSDPMEMAFKDGVRSVALRLLHMIDYDKPEDVVEERITKGLGKWRTKR